MLNPEIVCADVRDWCRDYTGPRFHALLCDPPYELGFMGKKWDGSGVSFQPETWAALAEYLLPGAMVLAFGGTRTWHRLACAMEDAGLGIRDTLVWCYGSGFPKSLDISKAIDRAVGADREILGTYRAAVQNPNSVAGGFNASPTVDERGVSYATITAPATDAARAWSGYGTALKPAWEPIIVAMKPLGGTFAENALKHGVAGINVDGCRVGTVADMNPSDFDDSRRTAPKFSGTYNDGKEGQYRARTGAVPPGRWPANLIHDGSAEVLALFPVTKSIRPISSFGQYRRSVFGGGESRPDNTYGDSGTAARFFYCAKVSRSERETVLDPVYGLFEERDGAEKRITNIDTPPGTKGSHSPRAGAGRSGLVYNNHPTVKPLALTRYLATLILPPSCSAPRRLLVPFAGSGSEMIGAMQAGWEEIVGIEMEPEYVEIAQARIAHHAKPEA